MVAGGARRAVHVAEAALHGRLNVPCGMGAAISSDGARPPELRAWSPPTPRKSKHRTKPNTAEIPITSAHPGRRRGHRSLLLCVAVAGSLVLSGCQLGVLDPKGPIGANERTIMFDALAIMLAII